MTVNAIPPKVWLLNLGVSITRYGRIVNHVLSMAEGHVHGYICFANVHMVMEAYDDFQLATLLNRAAIMAADGQPLRMALRIRHIALPDRCYGPETANRVCAQAAITGVPIGVYGGSPQAIESLLAILPERYPGLRIAYAHSPPYRELSEDEQSAIISNIQSSGARILFVGLGCPKQERWMAKHSPQLDMPLLGVGAWFDFAAGTVRQAPSWMQRLSLEWFYRLLQEPRRLWKRYAIHNPRFIALTLWALFRGSWKQTKSNDKYR